MGGDTQLALKPKYVPQKLSFIFRVSTDFDTDPSQRKLSIIIRSQESFKVNSVGNVDAVLTVDLLEFNPVGGFSTEMSPFIDNRTLLAILVYSCSNACELHTDPICPHSRLKAFLPN